MAWGRDTHFDEMIGALAGRQAEEEPAYGCNQRLVHRLWDAWQTGKQKGRAEEFIDPSDPSRGPGLQGSPEARADETRDCIRQKFWEG